MYSVVRNVLFDMSQYVHMYHYYIYQRHSTVTVMDLSFDFCNMS